MYGVWKITSADKDVYAYMCTHYTKKKHPDVVADGICILSAWIPDGTLWVSPTYSETLALQSEGTQIVWALVLYWFM